MDTRRGWIPKACRIAALAVFAWWAAPGLYGSLGAEEPKPGPEPQIILYQTTTPLILIPSEYDPEFKQLLKTNGFELDSKDGSITDLESGAKLDLMMLSKANLGYVPQGYLAYLDTIVPSPDGHNFRSKRVESKDLGRMLKGLAPFALARDAPADEAGKALQKMGIPISFNGIHLINPDGTATYYGMMVHQALARKPEAVRSLSGERLVESMRLIESAFLQAFHFDAPDVGKANLDRAWELLARTKTEPGETPLPRGSPALEIGSFIHDKVGRTAQLAEEERKKGKAGNPVLLKEYREQFLKLESLHHHTHHAEMDLNTLFMEGPNPEAAAEQSPKVSPVPPGLMTMRASDMMRRFPRLTHAILPGLLDWVEITGMPLSPEETEALVKSFPMGETIWRTGAPKLWREGITGQGVKVGVIDTGISPHVDLLEAVGDRTQNFTRQRGQAANGIHATHVAGIIHAIAPEAQLSSYKILEEGDIRTENPQTAMSGEEVTQAFLSAIDQAVREGNQIINISLGGFEDYPTGRVSEKIDQYAKQGVLFIISAGNSGPSLIQSPSSSREGLTAGALDVNDKMTFFSSWGDNYDPSKNQWVVKRVLLAPGRDVNSTVPSPGKPIGAQYVRFSGTSMAAPHEVGAAALLLAGLKKLNGSLNPVELSSSIIEALFAAGRPVSRDKLPSDVPPDQEFVIMDPPAAYDRLKQKLSPSV